MNTKVISVDVLKARSKIHALRQDKRVLILKKNSEEQLFDFIIDKGIQYIRAVDRNPDDPEGPVSA